MNPLWVAAVKNMNKNNPYIILCNTEYHYTRKPRMVLSATTMITKSFFWLWKMKPPQSDLEGIELRGKRHLKILGFGALSYFTAPSKS